MGGRFVSPGSWDTDKGGAQVTTGADLIGDGGGDNNIVFNEAGNYTLTTDDRNDTYNVVLSIPIEYSTTQ